MTATHSRINAISLRLILGVTLILMFGIGIGLFYLLRPTLVDLTTKTSKSIVDAKASESNLQTLKQIEKTLDKHKTTVAKADKMTVDTSALDYQDTIIETLYFLAAKNGVGIRDVAFTSSTNTATQTPATSATTPTAGTGTKLPSINISMNIGTDGGIAYENYLKFLYDIELTTPKMQVDRVSLNKANDKEAKDKVISESLNIKLYTKK